MSTGCDLQGPGTNENVGSLYKSRQSLLLKAVKYLFSFVLGINCSVVFPWAWRQALYDFWPTGHLWVFLEVWHPHMDMPPTSWPCLRQRTWIKHLPFSRFHILNPQQTGHSRIWWSLRQFPGYLHHVPGPWYPASRRALSFIFWK